MRLPKLIRRSSLYPIQDPAPHFVIEMERYIPEMRPSKRIRRFANWYDAHDWYQECLRKMMHNNYPSTLGWYQRIDGKLHEKATWHGLWPKRGYRRQQFTATPIRNL